MYIGFQENIAPVRFNSFGTDKQFFCNFVAGKPLTNQIQNIYFAMRQLIAGRWETDGLKNHFLQNFLAEIISARKHRVNGLLQFKLIRFF